MLMFNSRPCGAAAVLLGLAGVCFAPSPAAHARQTSGAPGASAPAPKVTMNLRDVEMRQALENLFGQARAQYPIDPSVTGYVSLSMKDQPLTDALQTLLRASATPLTYTVENGMYLVRAAKMTPLPSGPVIAASARRRGSIEWRGETNPSISMNLNDTNVRTVLQDLFKSARAQYSISPDVTGKVTLTIAGQTFENALRLVLRSASAPLTYTVENGVYIVKPRPDAEENTPEAIKAYARAMQKLSAAFPAENDRDVSGPFEVEVNKDKTVNVTGTGPIRDLLRQLMSATNADAGYFVAPDITGDTTVLLRKLPVAQALKLTLQNVSPRVTYAKENGVYVFHAEGDKNKTK